MSAELSELDLLDRDVRFVPDLVRRDKRLFSALGNTLDRERHNLVVVVVDLCWQVLCHAAGVALLIDSKLVPSLMAVQRALLESVANLRYIVRHDNPEFEAAVFLAYTHLKDMEDYPADQALVQERRDILAATDPTVVRAARARCDKPPWTWSGLKFRELAKRGGVVNIKVLYGLLSGHAHANRAGKNVVFGAVEGRTQELTLGPELSAADAEGHANFARRGLHVALRCVRDVIDSPDLRLPPPDPQRFRFEHPDASQE